MKGNKLFYVPVTGVALHPTSPKMDVRGQENDILQSKLNTECASHGQIYDRISVRIHAMLHERTFNY